MSNHAFSHPYDSHFHLTNLFFCLDIYRLDIGWFHSWFQYAWKMSDWMACQPLEGKRKCDEHYGIQIRNVTCDAKCGGKAEVEDVCEQFNTRPVSSRVCKLNCPQDCIATEFGDWSDCNSCWIKNRTRYRTVLQVPSNGGQNCTDLFEHKACVLERECYEHRHTNYQFKVGNWTECMSFHGVKGRRKIHGFNAVLGHRRRTVDCISINGDLVDKT